ncbi:tetratricopeptide repeat protein [Nocardia sp. N2S4-5]|uniref:tetratricopeptide repeat protein n=1 Tax=Nocardia sp. N2S4-5 TaxID=3351565 RepID=UPI0037D4899E
MSGAVDLSSLKQPAVAADAPTGHAVTEADFETKVLRRSMQVPVVIVLYSQRSPGSVELVKLFERLVGEDDGGWDLATVEAEPNMRIAQALGVQGIPTVIAVAGGQPLADFQGAQPEPQVKQWLAAVVDAVRGKLEGGVEGEEAPAVPEDPRFTAAEEALDRGDIAGAEAAYEKILAEEPANAEAKAALRQVRFFGRAQGLPADAIARADAAPDDIDAAFAAADMECFNQQPEAAFTRLITLIKRTAGDDRNRVRTRLVELFELYDTADPVVVAARRKLATALY